MKRDRPGFKGFDPSPTMGLIIFVLVVPAVIELGLLLLFKCLLNLP